jgi:hypothetical protein
MPEAISNTSQKRQLATLHFVIASEAILSLRKAQSPSPNLDPSSSIYDAWGLLRHAKSACLAMTAVKL